MDSARALPTQRLPISARALRRGVAGCALACAAASVLAASVAEAQRPVPADPRVTIRVGSDLSPRLAPHGGLALDLRAGWYARLGFVAEAGVIQVRDGWVGSRRVSATARFLLDPFGERRFGLYGGAGLAVHDVAGAGAQGRLVLLAGLEGDAFRRSFVPALELSAGGGARVALVLRPARRDSR